MKKILSLFFCIGWAIAALAQDAYLLSPNSKLTIDGTSTLHSWTVTANKMEGKLMVQEALPTAVEFEVDVAEIISERGATMDKKMHTALKKEAHPKVSFVLEQLKNTATFVGMLTIAGTKKNVEIDAEIKSNAGVMHIKGEKKIILQDYGMEPPTAMFGQIIVGDEVIVKFDLVFEKA